MNSSTKITRKRAVAMTQHLLTHLSDQQLSDVLNLATGRRNGGMLAVATGPESLGTLDDIPNWRETANSEGWDLYCFPAKIRLLKPMTNAANPLPALNNYASIKLAV